MNSHPPIIPDWKWGTPQGSRTLDRILDQRLSFREKMEWLEEAETLTIAMVAVRRGTIDAYMNDKARPTNSERHD